MHIFSFQRSLQYTNMSSDEKCAGCSKYFRKLGGIKRYIKTEIQLLKARSALKKVDLHLGTAICESCRLRICRETLQELPSTSTLPPDAAHAQPDSQPSDSSQTTTTQQSTSSADTSTGDPTFVQKIWKSDNTNHENELVELNFSRVVSTHKYCFICGYTAMKDLVTVPLEARLQVFTARRLIIPFGNVVCKVHLLKKRFYNSEISSFRIRSTNCSLRVSEVRLFMDKVADLADRNLMSQLGDFHFPEERLRAFTGLSWEQISHLRDMLKSMRNSDVRTVTQALIVFLFKLRTGNSNRLLASILGLEYTQQISKIKKSVMQSFEKDVLPKYFGFDNNSREALIKDHTSGMAKKLHGSDKLILICDGTYIRHEKSSNNAYQRKSFSGQKKVPLCKPFTICTTDGWIVDMPGPYLANKNDADILKSILQSQHPMKNFLQKGDILILDRGFRDVVSYLEEEMQVTVLMPALKGKRPQLTTEESNDSRFVTKLRWVVEAVHGIIKEKYHLLDNKLDNKMLPKTGTYCRIACFLNNEFGKRLDSDIQMSDEIVNAMTARKTSENQLSKEVEENRWNRRKRHFKNMTSSDILDFPELTTRDLIVFFTGTYQLKQTISYLAEILDEHDNLSVGFYKENEKIIRVSVPSRHRNKKNYNCYVEYTPNAIGPGAILRYCCDCANGKRTVGCCAHVAAIIYYLSNGRYEERILRPAEILTKTFLTDNIVTCINDDSEDDE